MLFSKRAATASGTRSRGDYSSRRLTLDEDNWTPPRKPETDWKKVLLLTGLGTLSWISTYTGMLELIQANMGSIGFTYKVAIGFAVAMLMLMIIWLLDRLFDRLQFPVRVLYVTGYLFLTLISVGFGFGFYWKFLESRSEATRSAESAVTQVQSALQGAQTRMEQLQTTLSALTTISAQKAIAERDKGNSCPNSRPGDGPRRRLRDADASRFGFAGNFVEKRVGSVKSDIKVLNGDLLKVVNRDKSTFSVKDGTRNAFLKGLGRKLNLAVTRFNAFRTDPQLRQFRNDFAERSSKTVFDNGRGGTFKCPDPELQSALKGVVRAIDQLPELEKPKIAAVEGSEAILEAFRRLTTTLFGALQLKLPPSPDELRAMQQRAVQSIENVAVQRRIMSLEAGLGDRDYIPLFIAIFVDFCLLLVSVSRPMNGFTWLDHRMGEAQEWPIIKILSRFRDIHKDEQIREIFDVFRHVVFDWRGIYYAAIPLNGTDPTQEGNLSSEAAIQAQLLTNLFTSFENDRVYTRTPVPFFTTGFIRRKLRDQGSKFSEAEAFRIYRFRKDMWQDWMLSAMMGAAKRVEARNRAEALERELFATGEEPALETAAAQQSTEAPERSEAEDQREDAAAREEMEALVASAVSETLDNLRLDATHGTKRDRSVNERLVVNGYAVGLAGGSEASVHALYPNAGSPPFGSTGAGSGRAQGPDSLPETDQSARRAADNDQTHPARRPIEFADDDVGPVEEAPDIIHLPAGGSTLEADLQNGLVVTNEREGTIETLFTGNDDTAAQNLPGHVEALASALARGDDNGAGATVLEGNHLPEQLRGPNSTTSEAPGKTALVEGPRNVDVIPVERTEVIPRRPGDDIEMTQPAGNERNDWREADETLGGDQASDNYAEFNWDQPDIKIDDIAKWFAHDRKPRR